MKILGSLLYNLFSAGQIAAIVIVCVLLAGALALNGWLIYLLHKRGEHKMHTAQLQKQREALLAKLEAMRNGENVDVSDTVKSRIGAAVAKAEQIEEDEDEEDADVVLDEADEDEDEEESEVLDLEVTEEGKVVRYNRSFSARVIQADNDLKARYSELKNYVMSFKGIKSRMSWKKETFHVGRKSVVSFLIRGKTLCICLATDAKLFDGTKYKVDDLSVRNPKNTMPCRYRITSDRKTGYAKELIEIVMAGFGLQRLDSYTAQDFTSPYKSTAALVKRRLIKIVGDSIPDFAKEDALAAAKRLRYNRSFEARVIQSDDELKGYYSKLKNHILSYKDVKESDTWKKESFVRKRVTLVSFVIRGKTLCVCMAMDPKQFEGTKYKVEDLTLRLKKTKTPLLYRVKTPRRLNYAIQLLDRMFAEMEIEKIERETENYAVPFVATETLIRRGLIKVVKLAPVKKNSEEAVSDNTANVDAAEEAAAATAAEEQDTLKNE